MQVLPSKWPVFFQPNFSATIQSREALGKSDEGRAEWCSKATLYANGEQSEVVTVCEGLAGAYNFAL